MIFLKFNYKSGFNLTLAYNEILDGPLEMYKNKKGCKVMNKPNIRLEVNNKIKYS